MNPTTLILIALTAAFGAFSGYVMIEHGYLGIWQAGFASAAALQVLLDLVIACLLLSSWIVVDARKSGRNPWGYVALTLAAGSFGPLAYILVGRLTMPERAAFA